MNRVVSAVASVLLNGNAALLPDVHDWFCSFAAQQSHNLSDICVSKLVTSANILSILIGTLQPISVALKNTAHLFIGLT